MKKIFILALIVLGFCFYAKAQSVEEIKLDTANTKILVLNYHQIGDRPVPLSVHVNDFDTQMRLIDESGWKTITPDELYKGLRGEIKLPPKPVMITFDDGYLDNYTTAFPVLKKYGLRATIFIVPTFISARQGYMTWEQLKEMEENGITIESHTLTHPKLEALTDDEIRYELLNSRKILEERLGHPIEFLAYPTGTYNLHIAGIASEVGYKGAFTIKYGIVDENSNLFALERVPIFNSAQNTMKDFFKRITWRQSFEEFGWYKH